jgi:hypothetical protein
MHSINLFSSTALQVFPLFLHALSYHRENIVTMQLLSTAFEKLSFLKTLEGEWVVEQEGRFENALM